MPEVPRLARLIFPITIASLEAKVEMCKEENYRLKRKVQALEAKLDKSPLLQPAWSLFDWDKAYGPTKD